MQQFDVKRGSQKCCITEQPFGPGEIFYSALIETSNGTIRNDFSSQAWKESRWSQTNDGNQNANKQETETETDSETETQEALADSPTSDEAENQSLIGWWKQRVPDLDSGKVYWAPDHILIALFDSLYNSQTEATNAQQETAWVMALLLMQKRLLARLDQDTEDNTLSLINKKTKQEYQLLEPELDAERIDEIQNELAKQLFSDRPVTEEE